MKTPAHGLLFLSLHDTYFHTRSGCAVLAGLCFSSLIHASALATTLHAPPRVSLHMHRLRPLRPDAAPVIRVGRHRPANLRSVGTRSQHRGRSPVPRLHTG